jgi:hypothetical protein
VVTPQDERQDEPRQAERDPLGDVHAPAPPAAARRRPGYLMWFFLAAAVILVAWLLLRPAPPTADPAQPVFPDRPDTFERPGARPGEPIRDFTVIYRTDRRHLPGREFHFVSVRVDALSAGDAFWIARGAGERLLVVPAGAAAAEAEDLAPGQPVTIRGLVQQVPEEETLALWGLTPTEAIRVTETGVYLEAHEIAPIAD